jgi:hypothetical protein
MLRALIDQDFDYDILRGVARRVPEWDFVTAQELGLERFSGWRTESRTVNGELTTVNGYPI